MRNRKAKVLAPLALVSAAVLAVSGGLASADGTSTGGEVHVYEADTALDGNLGTVILTGAITDHGTDHQGVAGGGNYNRLVLSKGSFEINVERPGRQVGVDSARSHDLLIRRLGNRAGPDRRRAPGRAPTRASAARSETTVTFASILPRLANGQCDTNATQYPGIVIARGAGTVSYK